MIFVGKRGNLKIIILFMYTCSKKSEGKFRISEERNPESFLEYIPETKLV